MRVRQLIVGSLLAAGVVGCAVHTDTTCVKIRESSRPSDPAVKKSPPDRNVSFIGGNPNEPGFGFVRFPLQMWASFRYELKAGLFTQRAIDTGDGIVLCTELDELESDPLRFIAFCAQRTQGGFNAFVSTNFGGSVVNLPGTFFLAGVAEIELAVEADGAMLSFFARPAGLPTWQLVETYPLAGQSVALLASLGVSNLTQKKGIVSFDDFAVLANADPPGPPTPVDLVLRDLFDALFALFDAGFALDAGAGDFATAGAQVGLASAAIAAATAGLPTLTQDKATKKAGKQLKGAAKKARAAQKKVGKQKDKPAINAIRAAIKKTDKAVALLQPYRTDF